MAGNYLKYAGRWDMLPVDSHELIALVAPRPIFLSTGNGPDRNPDGTVKLMQPGDPRFQASRGPIEQQAAIINDAWVDPKGTFLAGVGAEDENGPSTAALRSTVERLTRRFASASSINPTSTPGVPEGGELSAQTRTAPSSLIVTLPV